MFDSFLFGLSLAATPTNLVACLIGTLLGTLVGVLPGIGPIGAMALLMTGTHGLEPTTAIILMSGIFYGAMYGGSTTAILMSMPGEATSVITAIDGYKMAQKGRGGAALFIAGVGSFVAGTIGVIGLQLFAPPLAAMALVLGPSEFFAIGLLALILLTALTGTSPAKSYLMLLLGMLLGMAGLESVSGSTRFTFGITQLNQGIEVVAVAIGLFGITEVMRLARGKSTTTRILSVRWKDLMPTRTELKRATPAVLRGSFLGFLVGLMPGPSALVATFLSYAVEKRLSKHKHEFGEGAVEGVAGPEAANNSAATATMIPLLALGIPFSPAMAVLLGVLMIHGVQPGPLLVKNSPDIFWGVVASMYIGNLMLVILNVPLVGLFITIMRVPSRYLIAVIITLAVVGTYAMNNSLLDVYVMVAAGGIGYLLLKLQFDLTPIILGLILGPFVETRFVQSMSMAQGDLSWFLGRPITMTLLFACVIALAFPLLRRVIGWKFWTVEPRS